MIKEMIQKVAFCHASSLTSLIRVDNQKCRIEDSIIWIYLEIAPTARLEISDALEGKVRLKEAVLKFKAMEKIELRGQLAFKLTTADGQDILLGDKERPYCVVTSRKVHPDNPSESQLEEFTVQRKSLEPALYIL